MDNTEHEKTAMKMESLRYPRRNRNPPMRFCVNALSRSQSIDQNSVREALKRKDAAKWRATTKAEIYALQQLDCWKEIESLETMKALHTKVVLQRKRNKDCNIKKYKARLVVCDNEEGDNEKD